MMEQKIEIKNPEHKKTSPTVDACEINPAMKLWVKLQEWGKSELQPFKQTII